MSKVIPGISNKERTAKTLLRNDGRMTKSTTQINVHGQPAKINKFESSQINRDNYLKA